MSTSESSPAARIAQARAQAQAAETANAKASKALLATLLGRSIEKRFAAFEGEARNLTPADRRTLLKSIKDADASARGRPMGGGTASRIAIWRALLPYRAGAIALTAAVVVTVLTAFVLAARNTPSHAVMIVTDQAIPAQFKTPGGIIVADRLEPKTRYVAMSDSNGTTTLRLWVPTQGYAAAMVPSAWLRRLP